MKINLDKVNYDGEWVPFGDARLKIRPLPASRVNITLKDGGFVLTGDEGQETFNYCLMEQVGITGADDKSLPINAAIKRKIYDFKMDPDICPVVDGVSLVDFVLQYVRGRAERIGSELKNSQPGLNGSSPSQSMIATSADQPSGISGAYPAPV